MKFPEGETKILARPTEAATTIIDVDKTAAIQFRTVKSALYELQYTVDPASGEWISSGSFLVGNGSLMTFFDPVGYSKMRIYRVVSLPAIE